MNGIVFEDLVVSEKILLFVFSFKVAIEQLVEVGFELVLKPDSQKP